MRIRLKIAKWLAPEIFDERDDLVFNLESLRDGYEKLYDKRHSAVRALVAISRLRTPNAAHGVKKACDIAESALHHTDTNTGAKG